MSLSSDSCSMISRKLRIPIFFLDFIDNRRDFKVQLSATTLSIYRGTKKGLASTERFIARRTNASFSTIARERANDALIVSRMAKLNSVTRRILRRFYRNFTSRILITIFKASNNLIFSLESLACAMGEN